MTNIPTTPNRYGDGLVTPTIRVEGLRRTHFDLCHVGIVPEGQQGRQVDGGPLVPGPWGFAVTHALAIDRGGGSARAREQAITVRVGEPLRIEGLPGVHAFRSPRWSDGEGPVLTEWQEGII